MYAFQICCTTDYDLRVGGIYGIFNTDNGKWYIGQSYNIRERIRKHLYRLRLGTHINVHLQGAFAKYGESCFVCMIIEVVNDKHARDDRERFWIAHYMSNKQETGYNVESGGCTTHDVAEETNRKRSVALTGHKTSIETRKKISLANSRRICSEETRAKLSAAAKGRKLSGETKRRMSEAQTKRFESANERLKLSISVGAYFDRRRNDRARTSQRA